MGWPWSSGSKPERYDEKSLWDKTVDGIQPATEQVGQFVNNTLDRYEIIDVGKPSFDPNIVMVTAMGCACTASFLIGFRLGRSPSRLRRLHSMSDVPAAYVGADAPFLRGRVVSVSDGDTVRFWHVPTRVFHSSNLDKGQKLSEVALPIRVCTIDTPETAKFGKEGQPFGEEAKKHLQDLAEQKIVNIRLLTKDQYGRGVAELRTGIWPFRKYADEEMLRAGLAEVYQGGGAVYGHKGKDAYLAMEEKARANGKGIWSHKSRESAAEYKARMKAKA
mmetsp:Transcript_13942/g.33422  ORF Transcript_13942/g.33422 Transcript_13942/m.33422 type:complete len:276 (-) Transcript_13942:2446-3273(-)